MQAKEVAPKDASAVILLGEDSTKVYLAQRNPQLKFLGGWHAFPGGKVEPEDAEIEVENCENEELKRFIVAATRETFEEIGVLLVRGADKITRGQRASLHEDLTSGRFSFGEILANWDFSIDAEDFGYAGFWTTPAFSPARFKTRFFIARCPPKQTPQTFGEFTSGEFLAPQNALKLWENSEILISPPVLISLQILRENLAADEKSGKRKMESGKFSDNISHSRFSDFRSFSDFHSPDFLRLCAEKLLSASAATGGDIRCIELNPFITVFPLRTETLPPATHTNCFIVGEKDFIVIDAASPFEIEQRDLHDYIDFLIEGGASCRAIIVTHGDRDHTGGETILKNHLREKFGVKIPVLAHEKTAESLRGKTAFDSFINDGDVFKLEKFDGETVELTALHTPGHARGLLAFYDAARGFLLSGDNVSGTGSVLIAPPEGNMTDYLASLERLKTLPNLRFLCGSHGAAIFDARGKIENYIAHRLMREQKILEAVESGAKNAREIVERVYTDVSGNLWNLAAKSVEAHLEKLKSEKRI